MFHLYLHWMAWKKVAVDSRQRREQMALQKDYMTVHLEGHWTARKRGVGMVSTTEGKGNSRGSSMAWKTVAKRALLMVAAKDAMKVQTKAGRRVAGWYSTLNDEGQSRRV
jgi:hypothetical protein